MRRRVSIELIGMITAVFGIVAVLRGPAFGLATFVPMTLLGSAGAVLLGGSGTIQPAHLMLGFVFLSFLLHRNRGFDVAAAVRFPGAGFWLVSFTAVAIVTAVLMPRLFAGATAINAVGTTEQGPSAELVPLGPTSGNATQSAYLIADALCFLLCSAFVTRFEGYRLLGRAVAAYCVLNIGFAALDLATFWSNTADWLTFIRNADYQLHVETVVTGLKRIVGSFTETSSFAYATLGALGFSARLALAGVRPRLFVTLAVVSLALLVFSTSTTAYVAAPILMTWIYVTTLIRAIKGRVGRSAVAFLVLAPMLALVLAIGIALEPRTRAAVNETVSTLVVEKSSSQSGLERTQWNVTALRNVRDTEWFGAGLGSVRASSFPVALLSNTGVLGAVLFAIFAGAVLIPRRSTVQGGSNEQSSRFAGGTAWPAAAEEIAAVQDGARTACLGLLIGATISGALVDLGLQFFVFAALAVARPRWPPVPQSSRLNRKRSAAAASPARGISAPAFRNPEHA